jgi:hypothetical protein
LRYALTMIIATAKIVFELPNDLDLLQARNNVEPLRNLALRQDLDYIDSQD